MLYLDNNATTQPLPEVVAAMVESLRNSWGNPSSAHSLGVDARRQLEMSRLSVANLIGSTDEQVVFTGSGSEANNMVLGSARPVDGIKSRIVTTGIEHASVLRTCEYLTANGSAVVETLPVGARGVVQLDSLEQALGRPASLVSVQWVSNETGVVQPIEEVVRMCHSHGVPVHTDAAQAVGKMPIDIAAIGVDFLTYTAHKFHGPKGAGAAFAKNTRSLKPLIRGGSQEWGLRGGTQAVAALVGFGVAATVRSQRLTRVVAEMKRLRDKLEEGLLAALPDVRINGSGAVRICNTTSVMFPSADGEAMIARLDQLGIACSQGSACTSMYPEPSHVLVAMGLSERDAYSSIRFGVSEMTTDADVADAVVGITNAYQQLRSAAGNAS